MAYSEDLALRLRRILAREGRVDILEKKMFGGVGFLLAGNMLVGVWKEFLIARVGLEEWKKALEEPHTKPFDITGRPMKGWVMVYPEGVERDSGLKKWVARAMKFTNTLPVK